MQRAFFERAFEDADPLLFHIIHIVTHRFVPLCDTKGSPEQVPCGRDGFLCGEMRERRQREWLGSRNGLQAPRRLKRGRHP